MPRNGRLRSPTAAGLLVMVVLAAPGGSAAVLAARPGLPPPVPPAFRIDAERDCRELVPEAITTPVGGSDDGRKIALDALVLLDGVREPRAGVALKKAQKTYTPLNVSIVPSYRHVRFDSDGEVRGRPTAEVARLFADMKKTVGEERPAGSDVVLLLTDKLMYEFSDVDGDGEADEEERSYGSIGTAMCAGGVRWPETAFAMAEGPGAGTTRPLRNVGVTIAHELGHLLGAHHHQANCAEGVQEARDRPCTVMFNMDFMISSRFSALNAAVARGHAAAFASP